MELKTGMIVKNRQGHDEGYFAVVKLDETGAYIANGRSRLLEKPKRKNPKHLQATKESLDLQTIKTDKALRKALWNYNFGEQPKDD